MPARAFGDDDKLPTAGGTMSGNLTLAGTPPLTIPDGATDGGTLTGDGDGNVSWGGPSFAASTAVTSVASTFTTLFQVQSSGGTDTVGPFSLVTGALDFSSVLGQAWFLGYNSLQLASGGTSANGAMGASFFADAGDTNVGGRHGIEANWGCFQTPDASGATNALTVVAVNDNSNTVFVALHHGSGSAGNGSGIAFQNSAGTVQYAIMSAVAFGGAPGTAFQQPIIVEGASGLFVVQALTAGGNAEQILNSGSSGVPELVFQVNSALAWNLFAFTTGFFVVADKNSRSHITLTQGTTPAAALTEFGSVVKVDSSLVVGTAALATTATDGFIYAPSCAGTPTGAPTAHTGTVPLLVDTTAGKLWADIGGTWKSVTLT